LRLTNVNNFLATLSGIEISSPVITDWGSDEMNSWIFTGINFLNQL
jgi:hypothetical protein